MSEEVFVSVDNKTASSGRVVMGVTIGAAIAIGAAGITIGQFGNRVSMLEREMLLRAPATEVRLGQVNIESQLSQLQQQISEIQRTLSNGNFTRGRTP